MKALQPQRLQGFFRVQFIPVSVNHVCHRCAKHQRAKQENSKPCRSGASAEDAELVRG
jgi:hypothetical protein